MQLVPYVVLLLAQLEPIEAARHDSLSGTVIDRQGKPIADAEVFLFGSSSVDPESFHKVQGTARSDARGRFKVTLDKESTERDASTLNVCAYRQGYKLAEGTPLSRSLHSASPIELVLEPADKTAFRILDPDGSPVRSARLSVELVTPSEASIGLFMPQKLIDDLTVQTDQNGTAAMVLVSAGDRVSLRIEAPQFGIQNKDVTTRKDVAEIITLAPAGRLSGEIVADSPSDARGLTLTLSTSIGRRSDSPTGSFKVKVGDSGRFEIPALASGRLNVSGMITDVIPRIRLFPTNQSVESGKATKLTIQIPKSKRVRVRGIVRERGSKRPIAHVSLIAAGFNSIPALGLWAITTDAQGKYEFNSEPGQFRLQSFSPGEFMVVSPAAEDRLTIPSDAVDVELPPIELVRTGRVRGYVISDDGHRAGGAIVRAVWPDSNTRLALHGNGRAVATNHDGEFLLEGLPPAVNLWLTASAGEASSKTLEPARVDDSLVHRLQIATANTKLLNGRVLDERGKPVSGVKLMIRFRTRLPDGTTKQLVFDRLLDRFVVTDADGRFVTPRILPPHDDYSVEPDLFSEWRGQTVWLAATTPPFFTIRLYRQRPPADQFAIRSAFDAGKAAADRGDLAEAERQHRAAVDEATRRDLKDPSVPVWWQALAIVCEREGKDAEAEAAYRKALAYREAMFGPEHPDIPENLLRLASVCDRQQNFREAERLNERAMILAEKIYSPDSPIFAWGLLMLGVHHELLREYDEAISMCQRSLTIREAALGTNHVELAYNLLCLGRSAVALRQFDAAEPYFKRALAIREKSLGAEHPFIIDVLDPYARLLRTTGRRDEAQKLADRADAIRAKQQQGKK
jgi:tetratricopeptide (TPR) repeat protein/protocatechuate 3,4-dioxygenase beta subunit